jgi:hypothetical protein
MSSTSYSYSPLTSIGGRGSWIRLGLADAWWGSNKETW